MKNLKWMTLALAVVFAAGSAFTNIHKKTYAKYKVTSKVGTHFYLGANITGQVEGIDYHCVQALDNCAVQGDDSQIHFDAGGYYLDVADDGVYGFLGMYQ